MKKTDRSLIITDDGSCSFFSETFGENYHSLSGAVQESFHIFINCALRHKLSLINDPVIKIKIFEMGFGTGLNALLTLLEAEKYIQSGLNLSIEYHTIEKYPLLPEEYRNLNYQKWDLSPFLKLHECAWEALIEITPYFSILKINDDFETGDRSRFQNGYDIVYFDAFSPNSQPELWTEDIFKSIYNSISLGGVLTTYSSKGSVKQALRNAGFKIERLPGPGSKRHILRAVRN